MRLLWGRERHAVVKINTVELGKCRCDNCIMLSGLAYLAICLSGNPRKLVLRTATDRKDGRRLKCAFGCPHPCPLAWVLTWIRLSVLKAPSVHVCRMALFGLSLLSRCRRGNPDSCHNQPGSSPQIERKKISACHLASWDYSNIGMVARWGPQWPIS